MNILKLGLISKIAILVGIVELLSLSSIGYVYSNKYTTAMEENIHKRINLINKMIVNEELPISSLSNIQFMSNMIGEPYLEGFAVGNSDFIIVSSNPDYLGKKANQILKYKSTWLFNETGEKHFKSDDKLTSISYIPSNISSTPLYKILITIDTGKFSLLQDKIIMYSMIATLLLIILSTLVILYFAKYYLTKRIDDTLQVLEYVDDAKLDVKIDITNTDEIGRLQFAINLMIKRVATLLSKYKNSIIEIEKAQYKTLEQKEEFESIFNYSQDGIAIIDLEANFLNCNDSFSKLIEYKKNKILEFNYDNLISSEYKRINKELLKEVVEKSFIRNIEQEYLVNNNKYINVLVSMSLLPDQKRILLSIKDMTTSKMLESQSKLASMGNMIGNIAHQWRQPLSVITTGVTGMKVQKEYGCLSDESFNNTCDSINENAQYLSRTIDDFRNYIKGNNKKQVFNISANLNSFLSLIQGTIKSNNISIVFDKEQDIEINGYENELIQCYINIFNNSKDAFNEHNIKNRYFFINVIEKDNNINIKFTDNAGGIKKDILPKIFEPYFTTKHKSQGTGLGLHMTYNLIVDGMKGSILAKNTHYNYKNQKYIGLEFIISLSK